MHHEVVNVLIDGYGREINYLRISVTDHCNMHCIYCMPQKIQRLPHNEILRNEEIIRLIEIFVGLGVNKIRFTGGEPLLRKNFLNIAQRVRKNHGDIELCITTNGLLLEQYAHFIKECAIQKVNVSLDTLNNDTFFRVTGVDALSQVIKGIEKIAALGGIECKLNTVIMESTIDEAADLIQFASKVDAIRFIERMPIGNTPTPFIGADTLMQKLSAIGMLFRKEVRDTNVAEMYAFMPYWDQNARVNIGIIPSVSRGFCAQCNRVRITSSGMLRTCLHDEDEYNIKKIVRGQSVGDIVQVIQGAVAKKKKEHAIALCDNGAYNCCSRAICSMSKIGG